jgi:hypothetical protein
MQLRGAMFLDDKNISELGSFLFRPGLGRFVKATFLFVFGETHADSFVFRV